MPGDLGALKYRTFVPHEAKPGESVENHLGVRVGTPLGVGVLDPEDEHAAGLAGIEPVVERGARAADMQVTGRRGGKANSGYRDAHRTLGEGNGAGGIRTLDKGFPLCRFSKPVP